MAVGAASPRRCRRCARSTRGVQFHWDGQAPTPRGDEVARRGRHYGHRGQARAGSAGVRGERTPVGALRVTGIDPWFLDQMFPSRRGRAAGFRQAEALTAPCWRKRNVTAFRTARSRRLRGLSEEAVARGTRGFAIIPSLRRSTPTRRGVCRPLPLPLDLRSGERGRPRSAK